MNLADHVFVHLQTRLYDRAMAAAEAIQRRYPSFKILVWIDSAILHGVISDDDRISPYVCVQIDPGRIRLDIGCSQTDASIRAAIIDAIPRDSRDPAGAMPS